MRKIQKTPYYSRRIGTLPKGCQLCVKGLKTVLFITGICPMKCYYCPISDKKKNKDVVYANEWPTKKINDLIQEIKLCSSKGVGITGGDPLARLERTCKYIKALKKKFGKKFHIHLYAPLILVNENSLKKLYSAGLDEIRFHPDLNKEKDWEKIELANKFNWDVGIEIPVIPGKKRKTKKLIDFIDKKVKFLNLNELEISDTNASKLALMGFKTKDRISYAIKGSEKLAKELLQHCKKKNFRVHYCTCKLKDKVQLGSRIRRRAKNIKKPYDIMHADGTLTRGAIYLKELAPGFGYERKLQKADKKIIKKLDRIRNNLRRKYNIPTELMETDRQKLRILTNLKVVSELSKEIPLKFAIVREYPTHDKLILELQFL
ncbi:radical SAM protein [Candidatus Woesearchaeota archaeon]|nr:radical SAM protein [Candidatus Woesearchaeota archaeon]